MGHIENNSIKSTKVWNACGYVRLSREDGDREESNSITRPERPDPRLFQPPPGASGMRHEGG